MTKRYYSLRLGDTEYRLRLTMAGQRALKERWGEDILSFLFSAAIDAEKCCDLLGQCLSWPDSGNPVTDGEALYDLLVDEGWQGQEAFAALVFDLGAESGLLRREQAEKLTAAVQNAYCQAFAALEEA